MGLVLRVKGNYVRALVDAQVEWLALPGRWRLTSSGSNPVAVGDIVGLENAGDSFKIVDAKARRNNFTRRTAGPKPAPQIIAANLDLVVVVAAALAPATPFGLIDRLLVTAALGNAPAALLINKIDLAFKHQLEMWFDNYRCAASEILFASALSGEGLERLYNLIAGKIVLFAGASGVGKSTLANALDPNLHLRTAEISSATGKGRHTTSAVELHPLRGGGWLADTPGLRGCAPWDLNRENLQQAFPEIARLRQFCGFRNCLHRYEINCAVQAAAGSPDLPGERYRSYLKLLAEIT